MEASEKFIYNMVVAIFRLRSQKFSQSKDCGYYYSIYFSEVSNELKKSHFGV